MKRSISVLVALFLIIGASSAQSSNPEQTKDKAPSVSQSRVHQVDHLLYITGKVYRSQQGQLTAIDAPVKLENGMTVNPNGSYLTAENKRRHLQDGQCVDLAGNRYENLTDFDNNHAIRQPQRDKNTLKEANKGTADENGKAVDSKL